MNKIITTLILAAAVTASAQSPKGAEQLHSTKSPVEKPATIVDGRFQLLSSHIKNLGTIGKTGRYTIVSVKLRGIAEPNLSALLAYDSETDTLGTIASGVEPGLGVAIVNGGASVGSSFLFGSKLRPARTSVSNDSESDADADGGNSAAISKSEGGDAVSVSSSKSDSDASAGAISSSTSSVKNENSNSNSQSQGQVQGQQQGQSSVNQNANNNANTNTHPGKAPKDCKPPKKTKHGKN